MQIQAHTLSGLAKYIASVFRKEFGGQRFWVVAEVIGLKVSRGHCYMQWIEKDDYATTPKAEFRAIVWASTFEFLHARFKKETGMALQEKIQLLCNVEVQFHERYGMSLIVHDIDPAFSLGMLEQERRKVIERLKKEGVFEMNKNLKLPDVVQRIALISAIDSRGYEDFISSLIKNDYGYAFQVKLFPSLLQGDLAASDMIAKLDAVVKEHARCKFDAVVIVRGGGAASSLGCFNDFELARKIAGFPLPVITGVGHTADVSVVDEVAHLDLITPTEAGVFLVNRMLNFESQIINYNSEIQEIAKTMVVDEQSALVDAYSNIKRYVLNKIQVEKAESKHQLQSLKKIVEYKFKIELTESNNYLNKAIQFCMAKIDVEKMMLKGFKKQLLQQSKSIEHKEELFLSAATSSIKAYDPVNVLKRGYSITYYNNELVLDASILKAGAIIKTKFANGEIESKVE